MTYAVRQEALRLLRDARGWAQVDNRHQRVVRHQPPHTLKVLALCFDEALDRAADTLGLDDSRRELMWEHLAVRVYGWGGYYSARAALNGWADESERSFSDIIEVLAIPH